MKANLMRYLNSRIQSCYCSPIIWVFAPKNRETERVTLAMGDGRGLLPLIGRQGTTESVTLRGDRATALIEDIWCEKIRGCSYRGGNTALPHRTMLHRTIT
jgi:hypothetical protein